MSKQSKYLVQCILFLIFLQQSFAWDKNYKISTDFTYLRRVGFYTQSFKLDWKTEKIINHSAPSYQLRFSNKKWSLGISEFTYLYENITQMLNDSVIRYLNLRKIEGNLKVRFVFLNLGYTYFKHKKFESTFNLGFSIYKRKLSSRVEINYFQKDSVEITSVLRNIRKSFFFENKFVWNLKYAQPYITVMYQPWRGKRYWPRETGYPDSEASWNPTRRNLFVGAGVSILWYQRKNENEKKG